MASRNPFATLRHRDFRLMALGNMVSQLGFWAQYVGVGWAARELTDNDFLVSASFAAQWLPSLLLSPVAGVLADRYDRRRLVIAGNVAMVVPPLLIGLLVMGDAIALWSLLLLVILGGAGQAVTQPATVAFIPALVPADELPSAIALNSGLASSTRVVGPSLAGIVIAAWGVAWGFHLNAVSFLAVVVAAAVVRTRPPKIVHTGERMRDQLRAGAAYTRANPAVARLIALAAVTSFFLMQAPLMPIIARDVLQGDASTYGLLSSAPGTGFVGGALAAPFLRSGRQRRVALTACTLATGAALAVVGLSRSTTLTVVALGAFGLGQFLSNTLITTMLITASDEAYRGRVMGLMLMLTVGVLPLTSVLAGVLASLLGASATVFLCGVAILVWLAVFVVTGGLRTIRAGQEPVAAAAA